MTLPFFHPATLKTGSAIDRIVNIERVRRLGLFGIVTPVVGFTLILLAISTAPWFSWTGNALSDLGVRGLTATIFNGGLMATALSMMAFSAGVWELTDGSTLGRAGSGALFLAAFFLMGIGIFPETVEPHHLVFSVAFFVALPVSMFVLSAHMIRSGMKDLGYLSVAAGIVAALIWALEWDGVAIPEAVSALMAAVMSVVLGYRMRKWGKD